MNNLSFQHWAHILYDCITCSYVHLCALVDGYYASCI